MAIGLIIEDVHNNFEAYKTIKTGR